MKPFLDNKINASYLIASSLPKVLDEPILPKIHIHAHPDPIPVAYDAVRSIIPKMIFPDESSKQSTRLRSTPEPVARYNVILHIGVAPERDYYAFERLSHRDDYTKPDINGNNMSNDQLWKKEYQSPEVLRTSFNTEDVWRRWKAGLVEEDLRPSDDPGHYLCDFIYYTSLVEHWRRDLEGSRPVMFFHVPGGHGEEDLRRGRRVALGLIQALVWSLKKDDPGGVL